MPEKGNVNRAFLHSPRERRFGSAFQMPAAGVPLDSAVTAAVDFIFSKSSFEADFSGDLTIVPTADDTGQIVLGSSSASTDILLWNGSAADYILLDRGANRLDMVGVPLRIADDAGDYLDIVVGSDGDTTLTTTDSDGTAGDITLQPDGDIHLKPESSSLVTAGDGGSTNYTKIGSAGDLQFVGGAGLSYGSMYTNSNIARTLTTQNVWYEIDAATAWITGKNHNCTFTDPKITVTNAGTYLVIWTVSGSIGTAAQQIGVGIMIDSNATNGPSHGLPGVQSEGRNQVLFQNASTPRSMSGAAVLQLAAGRTVSLAARNVTSGSKVFTVGRGNLTVIQIAGVSA